MRFLPATEQMLGTLPPTCEVRDWVVFENGFHKDENYPPERCLRMVTNFQDLQGYVRPVGKIGHDKQQRMARSLGIPATGRVTKVEAAPERGSGAVRITISNVPTWFGGMINAGRYPSGSIDVDGQMPDPRDPARTIEGPIMTGISFLGEEQPAVKGLPLPKAVFADGTAVPPIHDPIPVASDVLAPDKPGQVGFSTHLVFSGVTMRDQLNAKLQELGLDPAKYAAMPDDVLASLIEDMSGGDETPFAAKMKQKFAACNDDPQAAMSAKFSAFADTLPDDVKGDPKKYSAAFAKFAGEMMPMNSGAPMPPQPPAPPAVMSDLTKRVGSLEASQQMAAKAKDEEATMAAKSFAAKVVDDAIFTGKIAKADRDTFLREGVQVLREKTFADKSGQAAIDAWVARMENRPANVFFGERVDDAPAPAKVSSTMARLYQHTDLGKRALAGLKVGNN